VDARHKAGHDVVLSLLPLVAPIAQESPLTDSRAPTRSAFSYRAFTMFLIGRIVSILSFQMLVVAIGWQLYTLTDSALDLGLLGIAQFVPMFVLTPLVGHAVDRYDNRVILLICQLGEAAAAAILALGTMTGQLDPLTIYVIIALVGAGREIATMVAIIPALVPRPVVPSATAWFASSNQIGLIVGPVLGGLLYELGPGTVYGLAVAFWCIGASFIFLIHMVSVPRASEPVSLQSLLGGFDFVWRDRVILGTISLDMCAVFLAAAPALYPCSPATSWRPGHGGLGCCAPHPGSAPSRCRSCSHTGRSRCRSVRCCSRFWPRSAPPSWCLRCRPISSCRWPCWP
jgi:MFS family permease